MSNWGVAKPLPFIGAFTPSGDVSCPAATETVVLTPITVVALDLGNYYLRMTGVVILLMGAAPPTACTISLQAAGFVVSVQTVAPAVLTANATLMVPVFLSGANLAGTWGGAGQSVNVSVNPTGQTITCKQVGTRLYAALLIGPDA